MIDARNPKQAGSNLLDAIPQTGECPINCKEGPCFYNGGRFYRTLDRPLIPFAAEAKGKIVRVNSGHDSNIQRDYVIESTAHLQHRFFNTSLPKFDFPGPVVFTCNGKKLHLVDHCPANLMFVRVRVAPWYLDEVDKVVEHYNQRDIPVVLTFMRYYDKKQVKMPEFFEYGYHILNEYWKASLQFKCEVLARYKGTRARMCGTPVSSLCKDCRNCEFLYWDCLRRMKWTGKWDY